jgi:hypothetical protein
MESEETTRSKMKWFHVPTRLRKRLYGSSLDWDTKTLTVSSPWSWSYGSRKQTSKEEMRVSYVAAERCDTLRPRKET